MLNLQIFCCKTIVLKKNVLEKIITGCKSNDRQAQGELYKLFSRKMFGMCLYYTKDYTAAEDGVQEGFLKVFEKIKQYKGKGSFEGWLRRVILNTIVARYRKENRLYAVAEIADYMQDSGYESIISEITAKDLLKIIQQLSPQYRMVFSMYAIDGYPHKEIAKTLGISVSTSKSNLSRARAILQEKVRKEFQTSKVKKKEIC